MNSVLRTIACFIAISVKIVSTSEETPFSKCDESAFYKPYVRVLKRMGDIPEKELSSTGFLDLSGHNRVILCLNGPAFLYKGVILEKANDMINGDNPQPKAYVNGTLGVYEHDCFPINHILKKDTMNARAGKTEGIIRLNREVYGVYLIGSESDYRLPEIVHFNDQNFSHIVTNSEKPLGHSFAMIGSSPGHGFCANITEKIDDEEKTRTVRIRLEPNNLNVPQVSLRRAGLAPIDRLFNESLTEFTMWVACHKKVPGRNPDDLLGEDGSDKKDDNLTHYQPFATYAHGTKIPMFIRDDSGEDKTHNFLPGLPGKPELECQEVCDVVISDTSLPLPDFSTSKKCGPEAGQGKLTDNKCYFWQYTADFYINLENVQLLQWRLNLMDEVRKIVELACPMINPDMIQLSYQVIFGYFTKLLEGQGEAQSVDSEFMNRQHPEWLGELTDNLILCRNKAKAMNFNYTGESVSPDEEFVHTKRAFQKQQITHQTTLEQQFDFYGNKILTANGPLRDIDEAEEAGHIETRKPPMPFEKYVSEIPRNIHLLYNDSTAIPLFYYREGIELEKELNYAIDVVWKAIATTIGYCNVFYQAKKPELFPRLYNSFFEDFLEPLDKYWTSTADNEEIRYFLEEFMDNKGANIWLDSCLEASYLYSDSPTYRPPRPLLYFEENQMIANYFLELPNDATILSPSETNPLKNLYRSIKVKRNLEAKPRHSKVIDNSYKINKQIQDIEDQNTVTEKETKAESVEVHPKSKGRIMG